MSDPTKARPHDLPPGEQKTGVTEGWQSGIGSTFPDPHGEAREPKAPHGPEGGSEETSGPQK
jgi:hypothetical protein